MSKRKPRWIREVDGVAEYIPAAELAGLLQAEGFGPEEYVKGLKELLTSVEPKIRLEAYRLLNQSLLKFRGKVEAPMTEEDVEKVRGFQDALMGAAAEARKIQ